MQFFQYGLFLLLILMLPSARANAICNGTIEHPCIARDIATNTLPRHWRDGQMIAATCQKKQCVTTHLANLWMSGSAMPPTVKSWQAIHAAIEKITHHQVKHIIDFDLRQESHGYLNGQGITLATQNDWVNLGKSHVQVLQAEQNWLTHLAEQKMIDVITYPQFKAHHFSVGKNIFVNAVVNEQDVAQANGFIYERLTIADHMPPSDAEVDRFINTVRHLPPKTWLHFHCHGGDGRTTLFMAMYDMLHNANKLSFNQIITRQAAVAPYYNLAQIHRKHAEFAGIYKKRLKFLHSFYRYAQDYLRGDKRTWSEWRTHSTIA